nr:pectate lyase [Sphingomonas formosensis]
MAATAAPPSVRPPAPDATDAFPGAQGYGRTARGGRGGRIIPVTTLADSGPGSLRACIDAVGPRVCIFRVGGVIRYTTKRPMITNPYITIAGQTAPGGGILLTHNGGPDGFTPLVIKNTHDVIIRFVRVRPDKRGEQREANSAITIENSKRVILDHVSTSWSLDENIGGYAGNDQITISNSIMAEGIPRHDKCTLMASDPPRPQHVSYIRNLCAHNGDRNPDINFPPGSCVEVINNILYDGVVEFAEIWESYGGTPVSIVGNYFRAGPSTKRGFAHGLVYQSVGSTGHARLYQTGNVFDGLLPANAGVAAILVPKPPCPLTIKPTSAAKAYGQVLAQSGAFPRDAVDRRIVNEVRSRTGHIVSDFGTLPPIANGTPYPDRDGDGMSDAWEAAHGTDPDRFDAWDDKDGDGWSNLDDFLDALAIGLVSAVPTPFAKGAGRPTNTAR